MDSSPERQDAEAARVGKPVVSGRLSGGGIESHAQTLGKLYELEFTQLEAAELRMQVDFAATRESVIYRECYDSATHALGSLRPGKFAFAIPTRECGTRWWGRVQETRLTPTTVSGELIDARFASGHSHCVAVIAQAHLHDALVRTGFDDETLRLIERGRATPLMDSDVALVGQLAGVLENIADRAADGVLDMSSDKLESIILGAALMLLDRQKIPKIDRKPARRLFLRAIEVHDSSVEFPTVAKLCVALGTRPRTLQAAFQMCAETSPLRFFLLRRLNHARRILESARLEETNVKVVAHRFGFTELGRFSVRYRQLFGEPPSATLKRDSRVVVPVPFFPGR